MGGNDLLFRLYITESFYLTAQIELAGQDILLRTRTSSNWFAPLPFHLAFLTAPSIPAGTYSVTWDNFWIFDVSGMQCPLISWELVVEGVPLPATIEPVPLDGWTLPLILLLMLSAYPKFGGKSRVV